MYLMLGLMKVRLELVMRKDEAVGKLRLDNFLPRFFYIKNSH